MDESFILWGGFGRGYDQIVLELLEFDPSHIRGGLGVGYPTLSALFLFLFFLTYLVFLIKKGYETTCMYNM